MKPWQLVLLGVFFGLISGAVVLIISSAPRGTPVLLAELPTPAPLTVDVSGAVANPGVYRLVPGSRVEDAVTAAGGFHENADRESVNLAARLQDGQKLHIPEIIVTGSLPERSVSISDSANGIININTATLDMLDGLPGIGETKAREIIDYREKNGWFKVIEEIQNVPGIGPGIFENIKELISIAP